MKVREIIGSVRQLGLRALALTVAAVLLLGFTLLGAGHLIDAQKFSSTDLSGPPIFRQAIEAAALLDTLEQDQRETAVRALSSPMLHFQLIEDFATAPSIDDPKPVFVPVIEGFKARLRGRPFSVYVKDRGVLGWRLRTDAAAIYDNLILVLRLEDGAALTVEPGVEYRWLLARIALFSLIGVVGLVLVGLIAWATFSYAQPLARLARDSQRFSRDLGAEPITEEGPRPVRALAVALNAMQSRLRDLVAQKATTLAAIAHDMRTYLTRLRMRAEFIDDDEQRARAVRDLEDMTRLIEDSLSLGEAELRPPRREPLALATFLDDFTARRQEASSGAEIALKRAPSFDPKVETDADDLTRVLNNLVDNALRYAGSAEIVLTELSAGEVEIAVLDEGPGVPEDKLQVLTQPYTRLESSRSRDTGGAGLGLTIAVSRAARAGATMSLANRPGAGLAVRLRFAAERLCA